MKILGGRDFRASDTPDGPPVAIVNRTMAAFWGGADPIGGRFTVGPPQNRVTRTVVGVVEDFRLYGASERAIEAQFYLPYLQVNGPVGRLLVRSHDGGGPMEAAIRTAVRGADAQLPVEEVRTLDQLRRERLTSPGVTTALLAIFAAVALVITLAGLAGLVSTSVSQRTREFGLRIALGASRGAVLRMVLTQGTWLVAAGIGLGAAGAYWFARLISRFLFATPPTDPVAYVLVALVLVGAALVATLGPAIRATTVDPLTTLKDSDEGRPAPDPVPSGRSRPRPLLLDQRPFGEHRGFRRLNLAVGRRGLEPAEPLWDDRIADQPVEVGAQRHAAVDGEDAADPAGDGGVPGAIDVAAGERRRGHPIGGGRRGRIPAQLVLHPRHEAIEGFGPLLRGQARGRADRRRSPTSRAAGPAGPAPRAATSSRIDSKRSAAAW